MVHELEDCDHGACTSLASWGLKNIQSDSSILDLIKFSDECVFCVDGKWTNTMIRFWEPKPRMNIEKWQKIAKTYVCWCTMSENGTIGLYFIDEWAASVASYMHLLRNYFLPMIQPLPPDP